jgi:hypothetical protein
MSNHGILLVVMAENQHTRPETLSNFVNPTCQSSIVELSIEL